MCRESLAHKRLPTVPVLKAGHPGSCLSFIMYVCLVGDVCVVCVLCGMFGGFFLLSSCIF